MSPVESAMRAQTKLLSSSLRLGQAQKKTRLQKNPTSDQRRRCTEMSIATSLPSKAILTAHDPPLFMLSVFLWA